MYDDEQITFSVKFTPENATVQNPKWTSSDESLATMVVASDGKSATAVSVTGGRGVSTITFECDADLGAGERPLSVSTDLPVMGRDVEATGVEMVAGEPEPK